jgi:hypothetical protein
MTSLAAGHWYDRTGPRAIFATGAAVYVISYLGFAAASYSARAVAMAKWCIIECAMSAPGACKRRERPSVPARADEADGYAPDEENEPGIEENLLQHFA